jgi:type I restriction enzyme S subunit
MTQATTQNGHVRRSSQSGGGWTETTLGEMMNVSSGKSRPQNKGKFPVYGGNGILDYAEDFNFEDETVIIGRVGAYCGCVYFEKNKFWLSDNALGVKANENSDIKFLYYFLVNQNLNKKAIGGAQPLLTQGILNGIEVVFPSLPEQRAIAAVLSSLDDKIELLREQNKTLEETAQAIFRRWFGKYGVEDELPEGWRVGRLGEEFEIVMGQSPSGESYNEEGNGIVFFQGRAEFQERFPKTRLYTTEPKRMAEKFDVLVSVRAPVGDINVASEECCIGRGLGAVRGENKSYALYKIKSLKEVFDKFEAEGTVFGSINKDSFSKIAVMIPTKEIIKQFENAVNPLDQKIFNNYSQIKTLSTLRDYLLPRLMRGEVRVKNF